jgi:hypothetical protein
MTAALASLSERGFAALCLTNRVQQTAASLEQPDTLFKVELRHAELVGVV